MSLSRIQETVLRSAGFTAPEVRQIHNAKDPKGYPQAIDLNNPEWQKTMYNRRRWVGDMRQKGVKDVDIIRAIQDWYDMGIVRSVWDFIRAEYNRSQFGSVVVSQYQGKRSKYARERVNKLYRAKVRGS